MLRKKIIRGEQVSNNVFLSSEDHTSDRDFSFKNTLDFETIAKINPSLDLESVDYRPDTDNIEIDLFFLKYLSKEDINEISLYIEPDFTDYSSEYVSFKKSTSELFEIGDSNGLITPLLNNEISLSPIEIAKLKPQKLTNPLSELNKDYPTEKGFPHFYNSFTLPLWDSRDKWIDSNLGFNNKSYMYNSFVLIEIYDDFNVERQKRITTIPIYVSDRYMFNENPSINSIPKQKRPVFNLTDAVDGFSFFFLNEYPTNEFYAKFYFWDALNGNKIQFVPSAKNNLPKKWLQGTNTFNQKDLYLKYELDYADKTYKIYDLNKRTDTFNIEATKHIDLYQLGYDDYWVKYPLINKQPTDIKTPVLPRKFGDLVLSSTEISRNIRYEGNLLKYPTLLDGLKNLPYYEKVDRVYKGYYTDDQTFYNYSTTFYYEINGDSTGYLTKLGNNVLDTKKIGLLKTKMNKCVNTEVESTKISSGSILIDNTSSIYTYIIEDIQLKDLIVSSNENSVDLSTSGSLTHKIKAEINKEPSIIHETSLLPDRIITIGTKLDLNIDSLKENLVTAFDSYKEANSVITIDGWYSGYGEKPLPLPGDLIHNSLVSSPKLKQITLANKLINDVVESTDELKPDVTKDNIISLLKTNPGWVKSKGITILVESLDRRINPNEEIILTVDTFLGKGFLDQFGTMSELSIIGTIELTVYNAYEDSGTQDEIISIPLKIKIA